MEKFANVWTNNKIPTDRFLNKAPNSLYHCTKLAMREFQKNRRTLKCPAYKKKSHNRSVHDKLPKCFRFTSISPTECWFVGVSIIQKKTKKSLLKTVKPWAKKMHCIRFEQENMVRRYSKRIETNKQGFPKKCLHCLPTQVCKKPQHLRQYSK
jgi:hypothetical protein